MSRVKARKPSAATPQKERRLEIRAKPGEEAQAIAQAFLRPSMRTAATLLHWGARGPFADVDCMELVRELQAQTAAVNSNDLARCEATLVMQASTLDLLFHDLLRLARLNVGEHLDAFERFMRLALKAQTQSRATLETLAEIKNPRPVAFVKQANIAAGHQQVNNGAPAEPLSDHLARAPAENAKTANKLLETLHGSRLDTRAPSAPVSVDSQVETVGTVNGADHAEWKGAHQNECAEARGAQQ